MINMITIKNQQLLYVFHFPSKYTTPFNQWQRKIEYFKNCALFDNN